MNKNIENKSDISKYAITEFNGKGQVNKYKDERLVMDKFIPVAARTLGLVLPDNVIQAMHEQQNQFEFMLKEFSNSIYTNIMQLLTSQQNIRNQNSIDAIYITVSSNYNRMIDGKLQDDISFQKEIIEFINTEKYKLLNHRAFYEKFKYGSKTVESGISEVHQTFSNIINLLFILILIEYNRKDSNLYFKDNLFISQSLIEIENFLNSLLEAGNSYDRSNLGYSLSWAFFNRDNVGCKALVDSYELQVGEKTSAESLVELLKPLKQNIHTPNHIHRYNPNSPTVLTNADGNFEFAASREYVSHYSCIFEMLITVQFINQLFDSICEGFKIDTEKSEALTPLDNKE